MNNDDNGGSELLSGPAGLASLSAWALRLSFEDGRFSFVGSLVSVGPTVGLDTLKVSRMLVPTDSHVPDRN